MDVMKREIEEQAVKLHKEGMGKRKLGAGMDKASTKKKQPRKGPESQEALNASAMALLRMGR